MASKRHELRKALDDASTQLTQLREVGAQLPRLEGTIAKIEAALDASKNGYDDATKKTSKLEVVLRADEAVKGHYLRQVFEACAKAGIWKVSLSAMKE